MSNTAAVPTRPGTKVRLRYASLIMYALNVGGLFFSFFFITLLARKLTVQDYGIWVMIISYVGYFVLPSTIFSYWLPRNISRGNNTAKTGFYASIIFGLVSLPLYLVLIQFISRGLNQPILPLTISAVILLMDYLNSSFSAMASGYSPQINGYNSFALKIGQAISGYFLIGFLALGLVGAVVAVLIGRFCANTVSLVMNRALLKNSSFNFSIIVSWLRTSWLPILASITSLLLAFDVVIVRIFSGTAAPVAYYGVSTSLLSVVVFAGVVSSSLYPKILSKKNLDDLPEAIWLTFLLALPLIYIIVIYAGPLAAVFGLQYLAIAWPLRVLCLASLLQVVGGLAGTSYIGLDCTDEDTLSTKTLLKSAIFKNSLVTLLINSFYLIALTGISFLGMDLELLVTIWCLALASSYALNFLVIVYLMKRDFGQRFHFQNLARNFIIFTIPAIPMSLPFFIIKIQVVQGIYQMLLNLFPPIALSLVIYFACLYLIDHKFRSTLRDIFHNILHWKQ